MTVAAQEPTQDAPETRAHFALYAGHCDRCRVRFGKGAEVVTEGHGRISHLRCVEEGIEPPPPPPTPDEQLEYAKLELKEIADQARKASQTHAIEGEDLRNTLEDVYLRAFGAVQQLNEQKTSGR